MICFQTSVMSLAISLKDLSTPFTELLALLGLNTPKINSMHLSSAMAFQSAIRPQE